MLLKLKNIKNHVDLEVEIPDAGLVKIAGPSGHGKSTIMEAITEALWGDGEDIVTWGSKDSAVDLTWLEHQIVRRRGPERLEVTSPGVGQQLDAEAQESIRVSMMGMSAAEFDAAAYIRQGMEGSLLALGPTEQLKMIQRLSHGSADPEQTRIKIQKKINELGGQVQALERRTQELDDAITFAQAELEAAVLPPAPDVQVEDATALTAGRQHLDEHARLLAATGQAHAKTIADGRRALAQLEQAEAVAVAERDRLALARPFAFAQAHEASEQLKRAEEAIKALPAREAIEAAVKRAHSLDQLKAISAQLDVAYPGRDAATKPSAWAKAKLDEDYAKSKELAEQLLIDQRAEAELEQMKKPQACPDCGAPLEVAAGKIQKAQAVPSDLEILQMRARGAVSEGKGYIEHLKKRSIQVETLLARAAVLVKEMPPAGDPIPDPAAALASRMAADAALVKAKTLAEAALRAAEKADKDLLTAQERLATSGNNARILNLNTEIAQAEALFVANQQESQVIAEKLKDLADRYDKHLRAGQLVRAYAVAVERRKAKEDALTAARAAKAKHEIDSIATIERFAAAKRLLEVNDRAATDSIDATVDRINAGAQALLDQFFPEEGTVIRLLNGIQTKAGDRRDKLGIEVWHRGRKAKRVGSLSGGERSRARLAFQLSLAEIYRSPILMIDEGFAGLDSETKDECLELLRPFAKDRLILVIEHGASDRMFDHVVRIGDVGGNVHSVDGAANS